MDKIDWSSFSVKDSVRFLDFYINTMRWVKKVDNLTHQYAALLFAIDDAYAKRYDIFDRIIDGVPGLKDYMLIHSVFEPGDDKSGDWLISYMVGKLDYDFNPAKQNIPKEVLDKLECFNPCEIDFFKEDVVLSYGMWKRDKNNRILDPIHISYWNDIQEKQIDMEPILSSYVPISYDDDLPF